MAQYIHQAPLASRIGTGLGQGLAEQLPKEFERVRMQKGLESLGNQKNLTPFQMLSRFYTIPGVAENPQLVYAGSKFLQNQMAAQAFKESQENERFQKGPPPESYIPGYGSDRENAIPSITTPSHLAKIQEGYTPLAPSEIDSEAYELYKKNPARFDHDISQARDYVKENEAYKRQQYELAKERHADLSDIQSGVTKALKSHASTLGVDIPANVFDRIENEAIQSVIPKSLGGEGKTEQEAIKESGKKLDTISRDYNAIKRMGNLSVLARTARETLSSLNNLRGEFAKNDDLENFADTIVADNGTSKMLSRAIAYNVNHYPKINSTLQQSPDLSKTLAKKYSGLLGLVGAGGLEYFTDKLMAPQTNAKTLDISKKLAPLLHDENASPLAVAYELQKRGYNPQVWKEYLTEHKDSLKLDERQRREISDIVQDLFNMNDWWLNSFTGVE